VQTLCSHIKLVVIPQSAVCLLLAFFEVVVKYMKADNLHYAVCPGPTLLPIILTPILFFIFIGLLIALMCYIRYRRLRALDAATSRSAQPVNLQMLHPSAGETLLLSV